MTVDKEPEYEQPARGDKAEAIRKKYCLENNQVYEDADNDYTFRELTNGKGDEYLCFAANELDTISHQGKLYFIKRIKN